MPRRTLLRTSTIPPHTNPRNNKRSLQQRRIHNLYPSAMPVNQQYDLRGYTYGYVQDKMFSAYASPGQVADMKVNLMIGVNVTLDILFKKEHIITPTSR